MSDWEKAHAWGVKAIRDGTENGYSPETILKDTLTALEANGWVVVPREPTEDIAATGLTIWHDRPYPNGLRNLSAIYRGFVAKAKKGVSK